jgi:hypothetical protein
MRDLFRLGRKLQRQVFEPSVVVLRVLRVLRVLHANYALFFNCFHLYWTKVMG